MGADFTHQLTISKRKEVLDATVHHREPPKVIHLDNIVEPAESREMKSPAESINNGGLLLAPHPIVAAVDEFWKPAVADVADDAAQSSENQVDAGNTSASHDFYNMVLDILDTFHSAAEMEVRRTRKREFQRQAALDMLT